MADKIPTRTALEAEIQLRAFLRYQEAGEPELQPPFLYSDAELARDLRTYMTYVGQTFYTLLQRAEQSLSSESAGTSSDAVLE